ncbi:MAG: glucose-1-phosphate thymidylyltransferase RfbA [Anaerolineaceae bacterium]|nr:glucose-1-phosphate thymidylyltransferase RfbA [Anaerolineaceae bacterium]
MRGIILAGGHGTRLYPLTLAMSKQLLPVYDKPMIYYPLSMLMLAGIKDILIITTQEDSSAFKRLLQDGSQWGISIEFAVQEKPRGLADAFVIGEDFIGDDSACLMLGDNIFFGTGLPDMLRKAAQIEEGAVIFAYPVKDPERYGVVEFNQKYEVISLEEKPEEPRSNYAVPGIYFYDKTVVRMAKSLEPSPRGEIEITDLNKMYLDQGKLRVQVLGRGIAWLDAGTHESLLQASSFVQAVEERQGLMVANLEEIAYRMGFINSVQVEKLARTLDMNHYGQYLLELLEEEPFDDSLFN